MKNENARHGFQEDLPREELEAPSAGELPDSGVPSLDPWVEPPRDVEPWRPPAPTEQPVTASPEALPGDSPAHDEPAADDDGETAVVHQEPDWLKPGRIGREGIGSKPRGNLPGRTPRGGGLGRSNDIIFCPVWKEYVPRRRCRTCPVPMVVEGASECPRVSGRQ